MNDELKVSIGLLIKILSGEITAKAMSELYEIQNGNKKVIKEHLKAIIKIMTKALEELENE